MTRLSGEVDTRGKGQVGPAPGQPVPDDSLIRGSSVLEALAPQVAHAEQP